MQESVASPNQLLRIPTKEVSVGGLLIGNYHPIRLQTMTTTDTMDTEGTVAQTIRCIEAGAELVRITAPSKKEAENLLNIKNELHRQGYHTPLVADIHFTPNAAEIAARIVEKVRINPGNYVDKKKFEQIIYTDAEYLEEIERIRKRFIPLIQICKEYGTAMRIGTNHGSLSDRIMSRYGDTPMGMVESAMEFLRIARDESYHNIVLSMKASNPQVMVQAYRLLTKTMQEEFGECYPLHLGVTEAGDGEDGRIKSAVGIGTLLEEGLGDTVRVSLTEEPELEIPVCRDLVKRYESEPGAGSPEIQEFPIFNFQFPISNPSTTKRTTFPVDNIGGDHVPVVMADFSKKENVVHEDLRSIGYTYDEATDKWAISDMAADYIFLGNNTIDFSLPGTLKPVLYNRKWDEIPDKFKYYPCYEIAEYCITPLAKHDALNFVQISIGWSFYDENELSHYLDLISRDKTVILCLTGNSKNSVQEVRWMFNELQVKNIHNPAILVVDSQWQTHDENLIHYATECGALLIDGFGNGICLGLTKDSYQKLMQNNLTGRNYLGHNSPEEFLNNTAFGILQATRTRISKTEYISCPSCGRTLFDLQETTAMIRARTNHLKGVKIAIMGCIVNGPGEMADADFGYVGSGPGKITLYKGKEVVKRNVDSDVAVDELVELLKENEVWIEP